MYDLKGTHSSFLISVKMKGTFMKKRLTALMLTMVFTLCIFSTDAAAENGTIVDVSDGVTKEELNDDSVFLKQTRWGTCTITAAGTIMRRAAMLMGNQDWQDITLERLEQVAWSYAGLSNKFSLDGVSMGYRAIYSEEELKEMLKEHPEGIVAYDTWYPHAVALLDYDEETDTWYCQEPSAYKPDGIMPVEESLISINNVRGVWYAESSGDLDLYLSTINEEAYVSKE